MTFMTEDFCTKHLYPLILSFFCSFGGLCLLCAFFGITTSLLWLGVLFPILLIPIHFLSVSEKPLIFFLLFPFLALAVLYPFVRISGSVSALLLGYTEWWESERTEVLPPQLLLLILPLLLIISVLYLLQRNYWCRVICSFAEAALLLTLCILKYQTGKAAIVFFLGHILFVVFETVFRFGLQKTASSGRTVSAYATQLWPIVLVLMLLLSVLPFSNAPIRWSAFKNIWNTIASATNEAMHFVRVELLNFSPDFNLKFSGYNNSGKLGGDLFETYTDSIYARSSNRLTNAIYLAGNSQNIYTGTSWENDLSDLPGELQPYSPAYLDSAEFSYAVLRSGDYSFHDNLYVDGFYELRFLDYRSSTLFAPTNTKRISIIHPGDTSFTSKPDGFRFDRRMKKSTHYTTQFNQINLGSEEFLALTAQTPYRYNNTFDAHPDAHLYHADYPDLPQGRGLDSIFSTRRDYIYSNYLSLPDTLPERVYDLAETLSSDADTDYEKMLAFEAYLRNFRYTTSPEKLPKDRDLVDFFLFHSQEGYCTYFATTLAVLGRCVGIPTRYVQGYCSYTPELQGEWTIRSNNAHAWTECYLDGLGWIPLDTTPGYEALRYQPWHKEPKKEELPTPSAYPDWWSSLREDYIPEEPTDTPKPQDDRQFLMATLLVAFSFLILLLVFSGYILYRRLRLARFLQTASLEDRFYYEATQIFIITSLLTGRSGISGLFDHVTLPEFTHTLTERYSELSKHAQQFCNAYSDVRYGNHPVAQELCTFTLQYKSELILLLIREKGRGKYLLYRLVELQRY